MGEIMTIVKKTTRARKITAVSDQTAADVSLSAKTLKPLEDTFVKLANTIATARNEYGELQKQITEIKEAWDKEQRSHKIQIVEINQQEELTRKREKETYDYEITLTRKKAEDEFEERKNKWEKELLARKEEIAKEKQELEILRKQVVGFEAEKEKAIKESCDLQQEEISKEYDQEKKLREQEIKAEKELQALKIINLTSENSRLANEVLAFKKSLEEATAQLKDVAVKVIESSNPPIKTSQTQNI